MQRLDSIKKNVTFWRTLDLLDKHARLAVCVNFQGGPPP